ncbi:DUF6809 family protein [Eubacterium multiforme]|uniref:Control of competence regulator ComK, YlbF/YmcA n=1 Tax=Eubacterium multiforme TaxID=83339 RepID=A0ABT9UWI2_9FIRM|nr:DUF6809 family protein [Eubacterium multiforme]MDQ0150676.1 hypothetical protein [Eubacterium multiforme]
MKVKDQVKLFKNIIENEYRHTQDTEIEDITNEYVEYMEYSKEQDRILERLKETLSDEYFNMVSELNDINANMACLEQRHYFKEGVKAGLDSLKFLGEYKSMMLL